MPEVIRFACSSCRGQLKVAAHYAGKRAKCPKCSQIVPVPSSAVPSAQPAVDPSREAKTKVGPPVPSLSGDEARRPATEQYDSSIEGFLAERAGLLVGLLLMAAGGLVALALFGRGKDTMVALCPGSLFALASLLPGWFLFRRCFPGLFKARAEKSQPEPETEEQRQREEEEAKKRRRRDEARREEEEHKAKVYRLADENGHLLRELLQLVGSDGGFGNATRIRAIGEELNRIGGMDLMQCAYYGVRNAGHYFSQQIWDEIGAWRC